MVKFPKALCIHDFKTSDVAKKKQKDIEGILRIIVVQIWRGRES